MNLTAQDQDLISRVDYQIAQASERVEKNELISSLVRSISPELIQSARLSSIDDEVLQSVNESESKKIVSVSSELTDEERQTIFDKLTNIAQQPVGNLSEIDLLYFEQQLSDMLGFNVTATIEGHSLPFVLAQAQSLPHYPTHPTDQLASHEQVLEAGFHIARPSMGFIDAKHREYEKYGVSLPLMSLPDWNQNRTAILEWYKHRQVAVINPTTKRCVVGSIIDVGPAYHQRFQVGLTPEITRHIQSWHPNAHGKVMILFVDEPQKLKFGAVELAVKESEV